MVDMTQEDKNLLLKDLCARLPYSVICFAEDTEYGDKGKLYSIDPFEIHDPPIHIQYYKGNVISKFVSEVKPYLFPLSSMTDEQKEELYIITNGKFNFCGTYIDNCKPRNWSEWGIIEYNCIRHHDVDLLHTWLNAHHFDYRGLIKKGLAIDASGLNIY